MVSVPALQQDALQDLNSDAGPLALLENPGDDEAKSPMRRTLALNLDPQFPTEPSSVTPFHLCCTLLPRASTIIH